jgi:prepilin-type N-terminal cleavage/methylation domain-containing protein
MRNRYAFTLLELIFVIVIMGILGKFGVEFLAQAYNSFIFSSVNNTLQAQSAAAVESIASRLQFRIKDSVIARRSDTFAFAAPTSNAVVMNPRAYDILEWVGSDIDGFRGQTRPNWSGIIDIDATTATTLNSPMTDTNATNNLINLLSNGNSNINNAALFFIGANSDINNYGWDGNASTTQDTSVMHRINSTGNVDEFISGIVGVDFSGTDVYEYYQLAWTAYGVGFNNDYNNTGNDTGTLMLYYDYQPWEGDQYNDANTSSEILMENVSTFQFKTVGSVIKIQVCVKSDLIEEYSLCKEKTIF